MDNNSLQHYGVLGMRWGVRRSKAQLRRARGPNPKPRRVTKEVYEAEKAKAITSGNAKKVQAWENKLSNQELKQAIERCRLSTELRDCSESQRSSGKSITKNVAESIGTGVKIVTGVTGLYNGVVAINNTFNKKKTLPAIGK